MKTCKKCSEKYEGSRCRPCAAKYMKEWNAKNPDKVKASAKKKYKKNKEAIDCKTKEWARKNRDKSNALKKAYKDRNREKYLEQQRAYARKRYLEKREELLEKRLKPESQEVLKKWQEKNRERLSAKSLEIYHSTQDKTKYAARQAVRYALKNGKLIKPERCQMCSSQAKLDAHHYDYSKKLEVIWLCVQCHKKVHSKHFKMRKNE